MRLLFTAQQTRGQSPSFAYAHMLLSGEHLTRNHQIFSFLGPAIGAGSLYWYCITGKKGLSTAFSDAQKELRGAAPEPVIKGENRKRYNAYCKLRATFARRKCREPPVLRRTYLSPKKGGWDEVPPEGCRGREAPAPRYVRTSATTVSTCSVAGNMSTGIACSAL